MNMPSLEHIEAIRNVLKKDSSVSRRDLGGIDVKKYLEHYGTAFHTKQVEQATLYVLDSCLFDQAHGKDESAILQSADGKLRLPSCIFFAHQGLGSPLPILHVRAVAFVARENYYALC